VLSANARIRKLPGGWVVGSASYVSFSDCKRNQSSMKIPKNSNMLMCAGACSAFGSHGGEWRIMRATIDGVDLPAIAYAWSQKGCSYFITMCGSTNKSAHVCESKFEDEWGNANFKEIPRPEILHFYYEYAPLIDEHNKARQAVLAMEKRRETQNPWFCLITTLTGMCVVDMWRIYRYSLLKVEEHDQRDVDGLQIVQFTDWICANLRTWQYKTQHKQGAKTGKLVRIMDNQGNTNRQPTTYQIENGKSVGSAITQQCFICRMLLTEKEGTPYRPTSFWCKDCHVPICGVDRTGDAGGRELSCLDEHCCNEDEFFQCNKLHTKGMVVPKSKQVSLWPRRSKRARQDHQ